MVIYVRISEYSWDYSSEGESSLKKKWMEKKIMIRIAGVWIRREKFIKKKSETEYMDGERAASTFGSSRWSHHTR